VLSMLQTWAHQAEADTGECLGIIHVNGSKLKSDVMNDWCDANGYTLQVTAPYMSTHNGCIEPMHLTVMNHMHAM